MPRPWPLRLAAVALLLSRCACGDDAAAQLRGALGELAAAPVLEVHDRLGDEASTCEPLANATDAELQSLVTSNCARVAAAVTSFEALAKSYGGGTAASWARRSAAALQRCQAAQAETDKVKAATLALGAWGVELMQERECCNLTYPPYCLSTKASSRLGHTVPLVVVVLAMAIAFLSPCLCSQSVSMPHILSTEARAEGGEAAAAAPAAPLPVSSGGRGDTGRAGRVAMLQRDLQAYFMKSTSLRALPDADRWALSTANLFGVLQQAVGFQKDSAVNQFEHLLSLWRSEICMDADAALGLPAGSASIREQALFGSGLERLQRDLLDGLHGFHRRLSAVEGAREGRYARDLRAVPFEGCWTPPPQRATELAEATAFLLVWGEAGNVRFMPELVCFLAELLLAAKLPDDGCIFQQGARSGAFLARVVRPIYDVVFEENHSSVKANAEGRDAKSLKEGYKKFMPADSPNYDDWNELFCDAPRLVAAVKLRDGSKLFELPAEERFAALERVDWPATLSHSKVHRELHSPLGVFAAAHRVVFLHAALFLVTFAVNTSSSILPPRDQIAMVGNSEKVRLATVGLLVPVHVLLWSLSSWAVSGRVQRAAVSQDSTAIALNALASFARVVFWGFPLITYYFVRKAESDPGYLPSISASLKPSFVDWAHMLVCIAGAVVILIFPTVLKEHTWSLTPVPFGTKVLRWVFWLCVIGIKAYLGNQGISALNDALNGLDMARVGLQPASDISDFAFSPYYDKDFVEWCVFLAVGFLVYSADMQFWFSFGCSILGILVGLHQRGWAIAQVSCADLIANIPEAFQRKVLDEGSSDRGRTMFRVFWDRIVEHMFYEDKVDGNLAGELRWFTTGGRAYKWAHLQKPPDPPTEREAREFDVQPHIFGENGFADRCVQRELNCGGGVDGWPSNPDAQWRLEALARGLSLEMPRPFQPPYIPGLTVLIPHYEEAILYQKSDLLPKGSSRAPLMGWLHYRYKDEFERFAARMGRPDRDFRSLGTKWKEYNDGEWEKLCGWASMRSQTLWRTVAGMSLYHQALQCHYKYRAKTDCSLGKPDVWSVSEVFTCMISMQMYRHFGETMLKHTNKMLEKFERSLKIAFIDHQEKGPDGDNDGVHRSQDRRYYSCLIDKNCECGPDGRRKPRLCVELPGFPILGDGKGDNQNHAIPFTRGMFIQAIDANQGAYFEQMLLLPCVLGEFRPGADGLGVRKIVGFPEHITSDFGTIGDFAAGAETAFGTILQRSYATLGGRMHYGHPDMMNKMFMIQQGGVSKATKTVNLSEDIFAGMDFTLRGEGRTIQHSEYFHVAKGRDLGFNTVLQFFSKLSAGTGEQVLTRQMLRLGQRLDLPEFLTFWYAHGGFYVTQLLLSACVPALVFLWLVVLLDGPENGYDAMDPRYGQRTSTNASVMATLLVGQYGWLFLLFILASAAPLVVELWLQVGLLGSFMRLTKQMLTLSPLHFIFQAKVIGTYISNEVLYGGAQYISTGRGLPVERRFFVGKKEFTDEQKKKKVLLGLYNDFAMVSFYDGARLFVCLIMIGIAGGLSVTSKSALVWWFLALGLTLASWLWAPFIFNPRQFCHDEVKEDLDSWWSFFAAEPSPPPARVGVWVPKPWKEWYEEKQLASGSGIRVSPVSVLCWVLYVVTFYMLLTTKTHMMTVIFPSTGAVLSKYIIAIFPPIVLSLLFCLFVPLALERFGHGEARLLTYTVAVLLLDVAEALGEMNALMSLRWWNTVMAGAILKYALTSTLLVLGECVYRFKGPPSASPAVQLFSRGFKQWLLAHRMARDVLVSLLIYLPLLIGVMFDYFFKRVIGFSRSFHNLLIYRDWGTRMHGEEVRSREAQVLVAVDPTGSFGGRDGRGREPLLTSGAQALPPPPQTSARAAAAAGAPHRDASEMAVTAPRRLPKFSGRGTRSAGDSAPSASDQGAAALGPAPTASVPTRPSPTASLGEPPAMPLPPTAALGEPPAAAPVLLDFDEEFSTTGGAAAAVAAAAAKRKAQPRP